MKVWRRDNCPNDKISIGKSLIKKSRCPFEGLFNLRTFTPPHCLCQKNPVEVLCCPRGSDIHIKFYGVVTLVELFAASATLAKHWQKHFLPLSPPEAGVCSFHPAVTGSCLGFKISLDDCLSLPISFLVQLFKPKRRRRSSLDILMPAFSAKRNQKERKYLFSSNLL